MLIYNELVRKEKETELSRIAGEKIPKVYLYTQGVFMAVCATEKAANKIFNHYNYCRVTKSTLGMFDIWYVRVYKREKIER